MSMPFLLRLLAFPVTGPVRGFQFILEQIRDQALAEMLSEEEIQSLLIESSIRHQSGEISDEEYEEIENHLLEQLNTLRQLQPEEYYEYPDAYEYPGEYADEEYTGEGEESGDRR